ncbi:MAG: peptidyl-alpha-hydroxyglycine alpha-amidating lyase family protein [SAR324 cluster bacterium]|nr:peptidyl-alpha-hydroxyglycine alpha-amidating lyase family protein [SAR324 cluster bacterium]
MAIGAQKIEYEVLEGWEQLPEGWSFTEVVGVGVDSKDRVYVFSRGEHPLIVFDKEGKFLDAWGEGVFKRPHGVFMTPQDELYLVDDAAHTVHQFTTGGEPVRKIGDGKGSDTGYIPQQAPVAREAGPFNWVTNVAVTPTGEIYASDGYGNARVHKFSAAGEHLFSWGRPGSGPGEFNLPHSVALDSQGLVYVCDRENSRVQIFSPDGEFLREWNWVNRPCDIFIDGQDNIYIAELGFVFARNAGPHLNFMADPPEGHSPIARMTMTNPDGEIQLQLGGEDPVLPGNFITPHGIWADSRGDLYIGEVVAASGAAKQLAPLTAQCFQKFMRKEK